MNTITIIILGFLFGAILQYAHLNRYNVISGLGLRTDLSVVKAISLSIGIGAILLSIAVGLGYAHFHIKPFMVGGIVLGGLIFGSGMAILGYCPGTLAISFGEGSVDAFIGIIGGLFGGLFFTLVWPDMQPLLGPNWGNPALSSVIQNGMIYYLLVIFIGVAFIWAGFFLHKKDQNKSKKWILSGTALALLDVLVFTTFVSNRPIGASTSFPYLADTLTGLNHMAYYQHIQAPGHWEALFLSGAFLAGLLISLFKKEFKIKLIHENWKTYKGTSKNKRVFWAFLGGFILIFGARMAGGCTSGHILSGGMQLAFSSLVFAIFVFAGLLGTAKLFYKKK